MNEQITLFNTPDADAAHNIRRSWENAFQKWSDDYGMGKAHSYESWGCCGYGSMCDWCKDNTYGRPCVRALNAMCRDKGLTIDYGKRDFEAIWRGEI